MDISQIKKKSELVKITVDTDDIVNMFGEPVEFWMYDTLSLSTYFNFYKLQQEEDDTLLYSLLRKIILKEDGTYAIADDEVIPTELVIAILFKISEFLGKSNSKMSTSQTGNTQK